MAVDAWYVVKVGGTAAAGTNDGRYTVKPTGTFAALGAANYYDNIVDALTALTPPTKDSQGFVSHLHDFTDSSNLLYGVIVGPYFPIFVSVDDSNMDQSLVGGRERTGSGSDMAFSVNSTGIRTHGISFSIGDDLRLNNANTHFHCEKGSIDFEGANDRITLAQDGTIIDLVDTDLTWPAGTTVQVLTISQGSMFRMKGGKLDGGSGTITDLIGSTSSAVGGGLRAYFDGTDLTDVIGYLLSDVGASATTDSIDIRVDGCPLNAGLTGFIQERFHAPNQSIKVTNSSSVATAAEYQDFESTWVGDIEDQDSSGIVRIDDVTFESGEQTSLQITTTADCNIAHPMIIPLSGRYSKLSTAGEDTLTVELAVVDTITLTNANCYLRVQNPNGTTANVWDGAETRNADILAAGTTLSAGTGDWEDNGVALTGYNEYSISITISGGGDGYPLLELVLMEPSLAGTLYVSKDIQVS